MFGTIITVLLILAVLLALAFQYIDGNNWHEKWGLSAYETELILIRTARQFKNDDYAFVPDVLTLEDALEFEAYVYSTGDWNDKQDYLAVALYMVEGDLKF